MDEAPDSLALWNNATEVFNALSDLTDPIASLADSFGPLETPESANRGLVQSGLLKLDSLLAQERFREATRWNLAGEALAFILGPQDTPKTDYIKAVASISEWVKDFLVEMAHGRAERHPPRAGGP
jgi:hypothetical protein